MFPHRCCSTEWNKRKVDFEKVNWDWEEQWSHGLDASLPLFRVSKNFHSDFEHVRSKPGASIKTNVNVSHLSDTWNIKWCAVLSGKDMIYCLTPWCAAWCLSTMNVVGPEIENLIHFHLVKHWCMVISRKRSPHTEHDSIKLEWNSTRCGWQYTPWTSFLLLQSKNSTFPNN